MVLFILTFITSLFISSSSAFAAPAPSCVSKLFQFGAYSRCNTRSGNSFSLFTYSCANGESKNVSNNKCYEFNDIYQQAVKFCKNTCANPNPTPVPSTTSAPTAYPSPSTPTICKTSCILSKHGTARNTCISKCQLRYAK